MTSPNLLTIGEVADHFGLSESVIRRRIRAARQGRGRFPIPLFPSGHRVLFRRSDIEEWTGEGVHCPGTAPESHSDNQ